MMEERMISGYCRELDQNRIVTAELENGRWYWDCNFGNCPHSGNCTVAKALAEFNQD